MTDRSKALWKRVYNIFIAVLALASVVLVFLDLGGILSLSTMPFRAIDYGILAVFTVDYVTRFILAKGKRQFFKSNLFDLLAIIPFSDLFALFRFARLFRLAKLVRLTKLAKASRLLRVVGLAGRFRASIKRFLHTNGFIYVLVSAGGLILVSSAVMTYIEGGTFWDNLWWSIVTCTTVGYGDISPATGAGRAIAVVLMLFGIGLIGMLTSTLTSFFTRGEPKAQEGISPELMELIADMAPEQVEELACIARLMKGNHISVTLQKQDVCTLSYAESADALKTERNHPERTRV